MHMRDAAEQLFAPHPIKQTTEYRAARDRILATSEHDFTPDLLVKMFNDLDTVVFHGDLRYRVCLRWTDMRTLGMRGDGGCTLAPSNYNIGRIDIFLSADIDWSAYPDDLPLGVLLHEMLHAYFMVWCRNATIEMDPEPGQLPTHGRIFMAAARRIERRMCVDLTSTPEQLPRRMRHAEAMSRPPMQMPKRIS